MGWGKEHRENGKVKSTVIKKVHEDAEGFSGAHSDTRLSESAVVWDPVPMHCTKPTSILGDLLKQQQWHMDLELGISTGVEIHVVS